MLSRFLAVLPIPVLCLLACDVLARDIENITVSATPIKMSETGSAVSVISREDILNSGTPNLVELLRSVPGFAVSQQGSSGAVAQVRVRGAEANQILVLIDGIEANDLSQGGEFDFSQVSTHDIQRIEIVRGPQSALWGGDAMAGVVHIITRPTGSGPKLSLQTEAGSFGTQRLAGAWYHNGESLQLQLSADHIDTDGTNIARDGNEDDGLRNLTVSMSGRWLLSPDFNVAFTLRQSDKTTDFDAIDFFTTGLPVDADHQSQSDYRYASIEASHDLSVRLDHSLTLSRSDTDNRTDTGGIADDIASGSRDALRYQVNFSESAHTASLRAEYERDRFQQRGTASFFGNPNQNREAASGSIAAEYRFDGVLTHLSLSARRDNNSEFDDATSWRLTANRLFSDYQVYASVGKSVKNPTFTERYGYFTNFVGNARLKPERSLQWELGARRSFLDEQLAIGLTWYEADLTDEINGFSFDLTAGGFTAVNIDGESQRSGAEIDVRWAITDRLDLRGSYSYTDATQENAAGRDQQEVRRPEHAGALAITYRWPRAGLHLAVSHTGRQQDDYFPPYPPFQERVDLDAFTLVSLNTWFRLSDHLTLTARFENASDSDYEEVYGFAAPGFGAFAGIQLSW